MGLVAAGRSSQVGTIVRCRVLGAVCLIDEGPLLSSQ